VAGSLNSVQLIGNLGRDPEIRHLNSGEKVATFPLATSESYTPQEGDRVEKTEWHRIVVFGKLAETIEKYVRKGTKIYIRGQIKTRKWEKDGVDQYITEIVLQGPSAELILMSSSDLR